MIENLSLFQKKSHFFSPDLQPLRKNDVYKNQKTETKHLKTFNSQSYENN
jgi:hypothetical protein